MTSALTGEGEVSQNRTSVSEVAWMYWISPKCGQGGGGKKPKKLWTSDVPNYELDYMVPNP